MSWSGKPVDFAKMIEELKTVREKFNMPKGLLARARITTGDRSMFNYYKNWKWIFFRSLFCIFGGYLLLVVITYPPM